uniref:Uncharacterized protein n=1 Tax=Meloidogyne hapla TaxID=6305 RepID=A0A1I8AY94_MELHA
MCQRQMDMCQGITPPKCSGQQKETKKEKTKLIKQHNKDENKYRNDENEFMEIPESAQIEKVLVKESEADWSLDSGVVLEDNGNEKGKLVKGILKQKMMKKEENKEKEAQKDEKREEKEEGKEEGKKKEEMKEDIKNEEKGQEEGNKDKEGQKEEKDKKEVEQNVTTKNSTNDENKNNNKIINIEQKLEKRKEKIAEKEEQENGGEEEVEDSSDWSLLVKGRGRRALTSPLQILPFSSSLRGNQLEVDVASPQMLVLDKEDYDRIGKTKEDKNNNLIKNFEEKNEIKENYCFGNEQIIVGILTVFVAILAVYTAFWIVQKRWKKRNINEISYLGGKLICR